MVSCDACKCSPVNVKKEQDYDDHAPFSPNRVIEEEGEKDHEEVEEDSREKKRQPRVC